MNSNVRSYLRAQAHDLRPIVMVGKGGVNDSVIAALEEALVHHELVKIKFQDFKGEVRPLSDQLAAATSAEVVSMVGFTAVLFRQNPKDPDRLIKIPANLL
ncbi:MAG: YhbY family RNA-binding protein [Sphaerochaetaceae bacterium]|jgi:RNA-binding protein